MNAEFGSMYFSALLPTDTPWLCKPLYMSWAPVYCMAACPGMRLGAGTALSMLWPWRSSSPGKRAPSAATPGRWLGVSTNQSPFPAGSLEAATPFQRLAELDGGPELLCANWPHSQRTSTGIVELTCVNIARFLWMKHWVSEVLFVLLWGQEFC